MSFSFLFLSLIIYKRFLVEIHEAIIGDNSARVLFMDLVHQLFLTSKISVKKRIISIYNFLILQIIQMLIMHTIIVE